MLDKKRGYAYHRPFYGVDKNVQIQSGMLAFLVNDVSGAVVATTAVGASGGVPIGTFWKDAATSYERTFVDSLTFNASNIVTVSKGNIHSTLKVKVTTVTGGTVFTQGVDYTVTTANGVITRLGGGTITAGQTVLVSYAYDVLAGREYWENASTQWSTGSNYDRLANDTLGSGKISVVEGDAQLFTDQYDVTQTYLLNAPLYVNVESLWSTVASGTSCGRVISVPTANDPFLGVAQVRVVI
jgi:hypothetical protein